MTMVVHKNDEVNNGLELTATDIKIQSQELGIAQDIRLFHNYPQPIILDGPFLFVKHYATRETAMTKLLTEYP